MEVGASLDYHRYYRTLVSEDATLMKRKNLFLNYHLVHLCTVMNQTSGGLIIFKNHGKIKYINFSVNLEIKVYFCLPQVSQTRKL